MKMRLFKPNITNSIAQDLGFLKRFRKWKLALLFGFVMLFFAQPIYGDSPAPSTFGSSSTIAITNNSTTTDWEGPLPINMNPQNLINGSFVNSTAGDILFTDQNSVEIGGIGTDIGSNGVPFFFWADVDKGTSKQVKLYTFNANPATHKFPLGGGTDNLTVADDNSLDITDNLTIEASVNLKDIANQTIINKPNAFKLFTDANGELQIEFYATFDGWGLQNLLPWPASKIWAGDGDYDYSQNPNNKVLENNSQACTGWVYDGEKNNYSWSSNASNVFDNWSVTYDLTHDYPSALGGYNSRSVGIYGGFKDQHSDPPNSGWQNTSGYFNHVMYPYVNSVVADVGQNWFSDHEIAFMQTLPRGNTPATWALAGIPYNDAGIFTGGSATGNGVASWNQNTLHSGERLDDLVAPDTLYNVADYKDSWAQQDNNYYDLYYLGTSIVKIDGHGSGQGNGDIYDDLKGAGYNLWKIGLAEMGLEEIDRIRGVEGLAPLNEGFWYLNHGNGIGTTNDMLGDWDNDGVISWSDTHLHFFQHLSHYVKMNQWTGTYWPCHYKIAMTPFDDTTSHTKRQPDWSGDPLQNVVIKSVRCHHGIYGMGYWQTKLGYDANHSDTNSSIGYMNNNDCLYTANTWSGYQYDNMHHAGTQTSGQYPSYDVFYWYQPTAMNECYHYEITSNNSCGYGGANDWQVEDVQHLIAEIRHMTSSTSYPSYLTNFWINVFYTYDGQNTTTFDTNQILALDTEHDLKVTLDYPEVKVYIDNVEILSDNTSLSTQIGTSTDALVVGNSLKGWVDNLKIGGIDITTPTYVMDLAFEPSHNTNTQLGASGNSWNWQGTVADQSSSGNDATWSLTADTTDMSSTVGGLQVTDDVPAGTGTETVANMVGQVPIATFLTPTASFLESQIASGAVSAHCEIDPTTGLQVDPNCVQGEHSPFLAGLFLADENSGMPQGVWWLLLATLVATILGSKMYKFIPSLTIVAIVGGVVLGFITLIAGLSYWFLLFYTLWAMGSISIHQYWKA